MMYTFALLGLTLCPRVGNEAVSAAERTCSVRVVDLRCEYLPGPLGIDVAQPRLSWQLAPVDAGKIDH